MTRPNLFVPPGGADPFFLMIDGSGTGLVWRPSLISGTGAMRGASPVVQIEEKPL
jgi:hypothetical protein